MAWQRNYVTLNTGERIRYSLIQRPESSVYNVRFKAADQRWRERSTGVVKKVEATDAAHRVILEEYGQVAPTSETINWVAAKTRLAEAMKADGKRPRTIKGYYETLAKLITLFPRAAGPADITDRMAADFKTRYANGRFTRKRKLREGEQAPNFGRKTKSLDSRIRSLKAIFGWFRTLRLVNANPFENITAPELDRHEVKYVKPADVTDFFRWLADRFPDWQMPRLFFSVKALTACRLDDLCNLRSAQLQDGRLVFAADQTKNRSERYAILTTELYAALSAYRGETYLWERYPVELIEVNKAMGFPTHRQNPHFSPERLYRWVVQIMQAYQHQTGKDLSSHDFRRAAFTRAAEKDVHPKRAAVAFDVTAETMLRYYTATEKKKTADDVLADLAGDLLPERKAE
jgi:integrase